MIVLRSPWAESAIPRGCWAAIGNFDGLHLGHARVAGELLARARAAGAPSALLTFDPHPAEVVGTRGAPPRLLSDERRDELLAGWGLDAHVVHPFDRDVALLTPRQFVERVLAGGLGVRGVVVGAGFRFGHRRAGDVAALRELLAEHGAEAVEVEPLVLAGGVVSSSRIRELVARGEDRAAAELLGRRHEIDGEVVTGDRRGRTIGFPTANLSAPGRAVPGGGVHAAWAFEGGRRWPSVVNVGTRPTFGGGEPRIEVHVLGEPGDLYGRRLRIELVEKLREERRFDGVAALREQIERDSAQARELLAADWT